ncbi:MAG TPA: sterol desaturase family protein [Cyclobacteriaceae bacterium]
MLKQYNKPDNKESENLFEQPILNRLSRTHISVPIILFIVYGLALLAFHIWNSTLSVGLSIAIFLFGCFFFTFIEYIVHRYVFHLSLHTERRKHFQYMIHGVHHHHPKDKSRLAMPPLLSITIATVLLFVFKLILGSYVFVFLPGFLFGYAYYLMIHYIVHIHRPPKNIFKHLWINHSIHHYKDGEIAFGVTSPLWDYICGTMKSKATDSVSVQSKDN